MSSGNLQLAALLLGIVIGGALVWMGKEQAPVVISEAIPAELIELRERSCQWEAREAFLLDSFRTEHEQQVSDLRQPSTPAFDEVYDPSPNADSARARFRRHALRKPERYVLGMDSLR